MQSLQVRLGVGLIISLIVLFMLEWRVISPAIRSLTTGYVAARLARDATSLMSMVTFSREGKLQIVSAGLDPVYTRPLSGRYFQLRTTDDQLLRSASLEAESLDLPMLAGGQTLRRHIRGPQGQELVVLASGWQKQGRAVTVAVAEDAAALERELWQFEARYIMVSLAILVLLIVVQSLIVHFSFVPLKRVRHDFDRLERGEITQLRETVPTEVRLLVREMNRLLRVMDQRLRRSRNALGNLAHALKTPLTLVMQVAERDDIRAASEARAHLIKYTQLLRHHLERELRRARLAGAASTSQRLPLAEAIPQLVQVLRSIYQQKNLAIRCCVPPHAVFVGDREDCLELCGNLLDNACKWAQQRISITAQESTQLILTIEDDGPGCSPQELAQLARRGVRIDESSSGHGLGLAIAKDIVEQYGGRLDFGRSKQLGGLQVRVALPLGYTHTEA
jgi:signal transduction histidine kinase